MASKRAYGILLAIFLVQLIPGLSGYSEYLTCKLPENTKVIRRDKEVVNIYDVEINVELEITDNEQITGEFHELNPDDLIVFPKEEDAFTRYSVKDAKFKGYVRAQNEVAREKYEANYRNITTHVNVHYRLETERSQRQTDFNRKQHCSIGFINNLNEKLRYSEEVELGILDLIQSCIHSQLCDTAENNSGWGTYDLQTSANEVLDAVGSTIIDTFFTTNTSLPNVDGSSRLKVYFVTTTINFNGTGITLLNKPDITRATDLKFTHDGLKFKASIDFTLERLNLHFKDFKFSASFVTTNGQAFLYISRVTFNAQIALDYSDSPCRATIADIDIYDIGPMTMDRPDSSIYKFNNRSAPEVDSIVLANARSIVFNLLGENLLSFNCDEFAYEQAEGNSNSLELFFKNLLASLGVTV